MLNVPADKANVSVAELPAHIEVVPLMEAVGSAFTVTVKFDPVLDFGAQELPVKSALTLNV